MTRPTEMRLTFPSAEDRDAWTRTQVGFLPAPGMPVIRPNGDELELAGPRSAIVRTYLPTTARI